MADPTRTLETDPRWLNKGLAEVVAASYVVAHPVPFLRDAKAAHQLLDLVVLTATFLDRLEADGDAGSPLLLLGASLREALAPWVPIPEDQAHAVAFDAWVGRLMAIQATAFGVAPSALGMSKDEAVADTLARVEKSIGKWKAAPISPEGLDILRAELKEAIIAQEKAEEQLRLARADADHLRAMLAHEHGEAREDFALMRHAAGTMADGAAAVRLLGSLLDRARNWVQDPELRAEITRHCPPAPRTEADRP